MRDEAATGLEPGSILTGPGLRESAAFALGFWLVTYATLSVWALIVTDGAATPISVRRLITTGSGSLLYWLTIRLHAWLRQKPASLRTGIVLGTAAIGCFALFGIRITVYRMTGGAPATEVGNNIQWLLLWAGYFLAGIGIFIATTFSRALREREAREAEAAAAQPADAPEPADPDFWIERAGARQRVPLAEVEWFAAEGNYVSLHARGDGAAIGLMRGTLAAVESQLDRKAFVRLHRSILCRAAAIRTLRRLPSGATVAELDSGAEVPVGRRFRSDVDAILGLRGTFVPAG
jgi:hypothetical protein